MIRWFIIFSGMALFMGCRSAAPLTPDPSNHGAVLNAWFTELDEVNFTLHDILLEALFVSNRTGKEVFVRRIAIEGGSGGSSKHYGVSTERGGAE